MDEINSKQRILKLRNSILPQPKTEGQYCRLCLSSCNSQFKNLFSPFNTTQCIGEVIEDFAKITISEDDEFSKLICVICFIKLTASENFRDVIVNSDLELRVRQINTIDPLQVDAADNNEDCDHKNIDVEEVDLKPELVSCDTRPLGEEDVSNPMVLTYVETIGKNLKRSELSPLEISEDDDDDDVLNKTRKTNVKRKRNNNNGDLKFECPQCDKSFKLHSQRTQHLINKHTKEYPFHCTFCNRGFATKHGVQSHEKLHTGERDYKCKICPKSYVQRSDLNHHMKSHQMKQMFKCNQCAKEYKSKDWLIIHIASVHSPQFNKPKFTCTVCNRAYQTEFHLHAHEKRAHTERKLLVCKICGKRVKRRSQHMRQHTKPYKCLLCNKTFTCKRVLNEHSAKHTGEEAYECDICKKTFKFYISLYAHKKNHDKTKCELCDKSFAFKSTWKKHFEKNHVKKE